MFTRLCAYLEDSDLSPRQGRTLLAVLLLMTGICSLLCAYTRPFWYDEICTIIVSKLSGPAAIWDALAHAADTNPPPFYLITKASRQLAGEEHIGYRLPAVVGVLLLVASVYSILARWFDRSAALVGAAFILSTPLATYYAFEARPYGLLLGVLSLAVLFWQRAEDGWLYTVLLAAALTLCVSLHYYAVFAIPAFALAEVWLWATMRILRKRIWIAIVSSALPLLLFGPLLSELKKYYGQNFWAKANIVMLYTTPARVFEIANELGWVVTVVPVSILLYQAYLRIPNASLSGEGAHQKSAFYVLIAGLLLVPWIAVIAAKLSGGGLTPRYMQPAILGGALAIGYFASCAPRLLRLFMIVSISIFYLGAVGEEVASKVSLRGGIKSGRQVALAPIQEIVDLARNRNKPLAIAGHEMVTTAYYTYGSSTIAQPYGFFDHAAALQYRKTDSFDLAIQALQRYFPLNVEAFSEFSVRHPSFLLLTRPTNPAGAWWITRFAQEGHSAGILWADNSSQLIDVQLNGNGVPPR